MHSYLYAAWLVLQLIVFAIGMVLVALTGIVMMACLLPYVWVFERDYERTTNTF